MRLGKKATMEKGTFLAYACTCNCTCFCANCSNCQTIAQASGMLVTKDIGTTNTQTQSQLVPALM